MDTNHVFSHTSKDTQEKKYKFCSCGDEIAGRAKKGTFPVLPSGGSLMAQCLLTTTPPTHPPTLATAQRQTS